MRSLTRERSASEGTYDLDDQNESINYAEFERLGSTRPSSSSHSSDTIDSNDLKRKKKYFNYFSPILWTATLNSAAGHDIQEKSLGYQQEETSAYDILRAIFHVDENDELDPLSDTIVDDMKALFKKSLIKKGIIYDDDPRLKKDLSIIENAKTLEQILFVIHHNSLLNDAFNNKLRIHHFEQVCHKLETCFHTAKTMTSALAHPDSKGKGKVASYIPQLAKVNPEYCGMSFCSVDGQRYSIGDSSVKFCVQSVSKIISYGIVLQDIGESQTHAYVGREPSGRRFNELTLNEKGLPHNPCINAGAIMVSALIKPNLSQADRYDFVIDTWKRLCGGTAPTLATSTMLSERETANRNRCLSYMMMEAGSFPKNCNLEQTLELYFSMCSLEVNCQTLSILGATLANGGLCPITGERVFTPTVARNCISIMGSCGMYDYSGRFAFEIGIPAKSGVSGALLVVIPGIGGIATFSPRLDMLGNSVFGINFCKVLRDSFHIHLSGKLQERHKHADQKDADEDHLKHSILNGVPDYESEEDISALLQACKSGDIHRVRAFVARGLLIEAYDYDFRTPLHIACAEGHTEIVSYLLALGASINTKDRFGRTPLIDAEVSKHNNVIEIIKKFPVIDKTIQSSQTYTLKNRYLRALGNNSTKSCLDYLKELAVSNGLNLDKDIRFQHLENYIASLNTNDNNNEIDTSIKDSFPEVLSKLIEGRLVVPDWAGFVKEVEIIYNQVLSELSLKDYPGEVSPFIPVKNENCFAVSICTVDGQRVSFGNPDAPFSFQSLGFLGTYALALNIFGAKKVHEHVGFEPSGSKFNASILNDDNVPHNPMVNLGALVTCSLLLQNEQASACSSNIAYSVVENLWEKLMAGASNQQATKFDNDQFIREMDLSDRNFGLAYLLKEKKAFEKPNGAITKSKVVDHQSVIELLDLYRKINSMASCTENVAVAAATLANGGRNPFTNEEICNLDTTRCLLSIMESCGHYNFSGEFQFRIGVPAKSTVAGTMMLCIPNLMGISIYSPKLGEMGHSVGSMLFCKKFAERFIVHTLSHLNGILDPEAYTEGNVSDIPNAFKDPRKYPGFRVEIPQLMLAAALGDVQTIRRIHHQGFNIKSAIDYDSRTPLHLAASEGQIEVMRYLIKKCQANVNALDRFGTTPLDNALYHQHPKTAMYLRNHGGETGEVIKSVSLPPTSAASASSIGSASSTT